MMELWTEYTLELSHRINAPIGVPTLHGHSYWVRVYVESSDENPVPLPMLEGFVGLLLQKIDHSNMNSWLGEGVEPTMEAMAKWIVRNFQGPKISRICIERKSLGTGIEYRPE